MWGIYNIAKNLDHGVRGIVQKGVLGSEGGGIIFKIVNFVIILISIQNNFLINSVTAYSLAEVCYFKPDQFKLSTSFPEVWQARIFGSTI